MKQSGKKKPTKKKGISVFSSEKEERIFWERHDSEKYVDWKNAKSVVFENLRFSEGF